MQKIDLKGNTDKVRLAGKRDSQEILQENKIQSYRQNDECANQILS